MPEGWELGSWGGQRGQRGQKEARSQKCRVSRLPARSSHAPWHDRRHGLAHAGETGNAARSQGLCQRQVQHREMRGPKSVRHDTETRNQKPEVRSQKSETRSQKSETRGLKSEARNKKQHALRVRVSRLGVAGAVVSRSLARSTSRARASRRNAECCSFSRALQAACPTP